MSIEHQLRDKLRKIETLFAGAATPGERDAAEAALGRVRSRLAAMEREQQTVELRFSLPDPWARRLFLALSRRYGLRPYRYPRQQYSSIMLRAPEEFLNGVLWPEFQELHLALDAYLSEVTERLIREEVNGDTSDATEIAGALAAGV